MNWAQDGTNRIFSIKCYLLDFQIKFILVVEICCLYLPFKKKVKKLQISCFFFFYWVTIISSFPMSYTANDYQLIGCIKKNTYLINTFKKRHVHLMYTLKKCKLWGCIWNISYIVLFPIFSQKLKTTKCQAI